MPRSVRTVSVSAPADRLWTVTSDVAGWPAWLPTVTAVERLDDGPLHVGARTALQQPRLPRAVWTVTALEEGRRFVWESRSPGVVTTGTHAVRPDGDGSVLELSLEQSGPLAPVLWLLLGRLTRSYVDTEAATTKARAEASSS